MCIRDRTYRKTEVGSKVLTGEPGYSVLYRTWARPTLEVHGMPGGFTAAGAKTVIPAKAAAKVSMRLVPNQDPDDILKRYTNFVKKLTPKGIETKIKVHSIGPACVVGTDNPYIKAATEALHAQAQSLKALVASFSLDSQDGGDLENTRAVRTPSSAPASQGMGRLSDRAA